MQRRIILFTATMGFSLLCAAPARGQLTVSSTIPSNGALGVAVESNITVTFSGNINTSTVDSSSFTVRGQLFGRFEGVYTFPAGHVAVFNPASNFLYGEQVEVTLSTDIQASGGGALTEHIFQFTAEAGGSGAQTFHLSDTYGAAKSGTVRLGDLNGDGHLDMAVMNKSGLMIYINNGRGYFTALDETGPAPGSEDGDAVLGDVNGDGHLDFFATPAGYQDARIYTNDGNGVFGIHQSIEPTNTFGGFFKDIWMDVGLGDFDGDGDLDAFLVAQGDATLANRIFLNDGTGLFSDSGQTLGSALSFSVVMGDFDGDGDLDAYVGNGEGVADKVYKNDGTGTFTDSGKNYNTAQEAFDCAVGDVNGDGSLDVVTATWGGGGDNRVLTNDGNAVFGDTGQSLGSSQSKRVALGDVDGDGDLDAVFANYNQSNNIWTNDGKGIFGLKQQTDETRRSYGIALGDVDGDGDLDMADASIYNEPNNVYLNSGPVPDLEIDKTTVSGSIGTNGNETFLLAITNAGDAAAYGVAVTDALPAGLSFSAAGSSPECSNENGAVVCRLSSLAVGGAAVFTVAVDAVSAFAGTVTNAAACAVTNEEVGLYNNEDTSTTTVLDDDGDGLPDYYEYAHGLDYTNAGDAAENEDGDAHDNLDEFIAGTQWTNDQSYFTANTSLSVADYQSVTGHVIRWQGVEGRRYGVSWTDNLNSNYTVLAENLYAAQNAEMAYTNKTLVTNETAVYYRINVRK